MSRLPGGTVRAVSGPAYSFGPATSGPNGGPGTMVMSVACAEGRHGECREQFRCDCAEHRPPLLGILRAAEANRASSSLPDGEYRTES